jgi:hypothetical protein
MVLIDRAKTTFEYLREDEGEIQRTGWGTDSTTLGEPLPRIGFDF